MLSCGCVIGSRCHRHTLMVANLRHRFGDDKYTRVFHAPVDNNEGDHMDEQTEGLGASEQPDGHPGGEPTETSEAPAANDATGESDEDVAQTN